MPGPWSNQSPHNMGKFSATKQPQGTQYGSNLQGAIQNANAQHQANSLQNKKNLAAQQAIHQEHKQVDPYASGIQAQVGLMDEQRAALSGWGQQRTPQQLNKLANLNTAIGINPTQGMGPINSMKYQFTNPQFKSDVSKLANAPIGIMGLLRNAFAGQQPTTSIADMPTVSGIQANPNLIDTGDLGTGMGDYGITKPTGQGPLYGTSAADQVLEMGGPWRDPVSGAPVISGPIDWGGIDRMKDAFGNSMGWLTEGMGNIADQADEGIADHMDFLRSGIGAAGDWVGDKWNSFFGPEVPPTDPNDAFLNAYTGLDEFTDRMTQQYARTPETENMLTDDQGFAVNQPEDFESGYVNRLDAGPLSDDYAFTDTTIRDLMAQREADMVAQQAAEQDASQFDIRDLLTDPFSDLNDFVGDQFDRWGWGPTDEKDAEGFSLSDLLDPFRGLP